MFTSHNRFDVYIPRQNALIHLNRVLYSFMYKKSVCVCVCGFKEPIAFAFSQLHFRVLMCCGEEGAAHILTSDLE